MKTNCEEVKKKEKWLGKSDSTVQSDAAYVRVEREVGSYFDVQCGLRQGLKMSPSLFNIELNK